MSDNRRAGRIAVGYPTVIESIGQPAMQMHPNLLEVYSRVSPHAGGVGTRFPGTIRDLSTNGAFIASEPMPLLSRVAFSFDLVDFGRVEAIGWTLWRRSDDCEVPHGDQMVTLPKGFGVLFEAIPLDARVAIHRAVQRRGIN